MKLLCCEKEEGLFQLKKWKSFSIFILISFSILSCSSSKNIKGEGRAHNQLKNTSSVRLATFNIRQNGGTDVVSWKNIRLQSVEAIFKTYQFDVVGVQEPTIRQVKDMMTFLGDQYDYYVVDARNNADSNRSHSNPIFWKKDRFNLVDHGVFWYSRTPTIPGSVSWNASQARNCVWVKLFDKKNEVEFYVFNSHFDHKSTIAKKMSAELLVDKIKEIAENNLVMCTGDLNTNQTTQIFETLTNSSLLNDSHAVADSIVNDDYRTSHGYSYIRAEKDSPRIDHIFLSRNFSGKIILWKCITDRFDGKWASDHYPVFIDFL